MKTLYTKLLTGGIVVTLMSAIFVKSHIDHEKLNLVQPEASQSPLLDASKHTKITGIHKVLDTALKTVKTLDLEVTDLRFQLSALKIEQAKFNTDMLAKINRFAHVSNLNSGLPMMTEQQSNSDAEPIKTKNNSADDDALQADRLANMDDTLFAQTSDPNWDADAADQITRNFSTAEFQNSQLQAVVCRGIICRIEIDQDEENVMSELLENEQPLIPWSHKGRVETIENESGDITTIMYVTREDYDFPSNF